MWRNVRRCAVLSLGCATVSLLARDARSTMANLASAILFFVSARCNEWVDAQSAYAAVRPHS